MTQDITFAEIQEYAERFIRVKIARVARCLRLGRTDVEDLRQDLLVHLFQRFPKYDSKKGTPKSFVVMVVNNRIRTILRLKAQSKEALAQRPLSLEDQIEDEERNSVSRADIIDAEEILMNAGIITRRSIDHIELQLDLKLFMNSLPDRLRCTCLMLGSTPVLAIARETGVSRDRVRSDIAEIRFRAETFGLREYL